MYIYIYTLNKKLNIGHLYTYEHIWVVKVGWEKNAEALRRGRVDNAAIDGSQGGGASMLSTTLYCTYIYIMFLVYVLSTSLSLSHTHALCYNTPPPPPSISLGKHGGDGGYLSEKYTATVKAEAEAKRRMFALDPIQVRFRVRVRVLGVFDKERKQQ
jgi:hypothetical protein